MTEEIKEILDIIKKCYEMYEDNEHWKTLLDYITNLQQENEFLKLNNPEMNLEHFRIVKENKRKIDNLRKENKELKEDLKNKPIVDFTFDVYKELEDYKSRCKKAIEYIKTHYLKPNEPELENILNGGNNNE